MKEIPNDDPSNFAKYIPHRKFGDERTPTESECKSLARLMYMAFCDLRGLGRDGKMSQARALAEAIHNIPLLMYTQNFSFRAFREFLLSYRDNYAKTQFNYLQEWERLNAQAGGA